MQKALDIIQRVLDTHTSRKNALTQAEGPQCECDECKGLRKAIRLLENK